MPLTEQRVQQLRKRHEVLQGHVAELRAEPPQGVSKAKARDWAEHVDGAQRLAAQMKRVLDSATLRLPAGESTIARISKGERTEIRVGVLELAEGRRIEIRRWHVHSGTNEWKPAVRALVLDLRSLQQLTAGLMLAEEVLNARPA